MPDDGEGQLPLPNGEGPDSQDRGAADEAFAAVVLDEKFVEAAEIHEPSAAERILYAALERAESEAAEHPFPGDFPGDLSAQYAESEIDSELDPDLDDEDDEEGRFDRSDYMRYLPDEDDRDDRDDRDEYVGAAYGAGPARRARTPRGWRPPRWQRPVACVLAVVMGISVLAFALIAVQRAGSQRQDQRPSSPVIEPGTAPVPREAEGDENDP